MILKEKGISHGVKVIAGDEDIVGYIITKINNEKISSAAEAVNQLDNLRNRYNYTIIEMINTDGEKERFRVQ